LNRFSTATSSKLQKLVCLLEQVQQVSEYEEKIQILEKEESVRSFHVENFLPALQKEELFVLKSVLAIGQQKVFSDVSMEKKQSLLDMLVAVERFYQGMGGLIGYHVTLLQFLYKPMRRFSPENVKYHAPLGLDLSSLSSSVKESIYHAVERMHELSEIYPVGGAADRLRLQDPESKTALPAALLPFNGKTMLGGLIEDLQVREYLHYKIKGKQIFVPIAMMTSQEKRNHEHILKLCEKNQWFFRPKDKFSFFCQPLVPVVDSQGDWVLCGPGKPLVKPGGHGVIWKLAKDAGVFHWLKELGVTKSIVRQINNPVSSEDYGLLAFSGYGLKEGKLFGFASCERQVKASEGINVVVEKETDQGFSYTLTNIEYCDFDTYSIQDEPVHSEGKYSKFPSNTNLLFVDLLAVEKALEKCPIPGMLINKKKVVFYSDTEEVKEEEVIRLESTMQNIADSFSSHFPSRLEASQVGNLDAYITFNARKKTISAAKKEFVLGSSLLETPDGCFLDVLSNMRELLKDFCHFTLPEEASSNIHPSFLFYGHQALGPLYSVIGQKLRKGSLSLGSELRLHIAECDIEELHVEGSLHIIAERVIGEVDQEGVLRYSENVGRCFLKNVTVRNLGVDHTAPNIFWKKKIHHQEVCSIFLEGRSEFYAEDVEFRGAFAITVRDGYKVTARNIEGEIALIEEPLPCVSWHWHYEFLQDHTLHIEKRLHCK
jgi:UTP---glucose-1-phosphate uridylyltransferase